LVLRITKIIRISFTKI